MSQKIKGMFTVLWLLFIPCVIISEEEKLSDKTDCKSIQEEFVETHHQAIINGQPLKYKAVAGNLILKDDQCQSKASLFFVSYTKEEEDNLGQRPITFCFNGGPGSCSVWLHLGVFGPRRVQLTDEGDAIPPYRLINNDFSILDLTDLVFIDPVSTGFSQAIPYEDEKKFHSVEADVKSIAEFIRLYVTRFNRWDSPKFLAGESYGTTRAASLAGHLHDEDYIYLNGIILISSVLNFQSINFKEGNDLPYLLFLPSYTATAWYHRKLEPDLQVNLLQTLKESQDFVMNEYSWALFKGDLLSPQERQQIIGKLARYTGLSPDYIDKSNLRVDMFRFSKELLRDQRRTIGRFDGRVKGIDADIVSTCFEYDPSANAIFGAFTATFNQYVRNDLQWLKNSPYKILTDVFPWDYGCKNQYLNVEDALRGVLTKNPALRVFVGSGYYDLATPYFATDYTFNHLNLDPTLNKHVMMRYYDGGHMMYTHYPSLVKMKKDLADYYRHTLETQEKENKSNLNSAQR